MEAEKDRMRTEAEEMRNRRREQERKPREKHSANILDGGRWEQSNSGKRTETKPTIDKFNRVGFVFNIKSLAEHIVELRYRENESAKSIQNGVNQLLKARDDVKEDMQEYAKYFKSPTVLECDNDYIEAKEMLQCASEQELASMRIMETKEEQDRMKKTGPQSCSEETIP